MQHKERECGAKNEGQDADSYRRCAFLEWWRHQEVTSIGTERGIRPCLAKKNRPTRVQSRAVSMWQGCLSRAIGPYFTYGGRSRLIAAATAVSRRVCLPIKSIGAVPANDPKIIVRSSLKVGGKDDVSVCASISAHFCRHGLRCRIPR